MNSILQDKVTLTLFAIMFSALIAATLVGFFLRNQANFNDRVQGWWGMCLILLLATLIGPIGSTILFALVSFLALREFITLTPTHPGDHRALFWAFFVLLPLQYYFVETQWYGMFSILIPVYAFIFIPIRIVLCGDYERFLERTAKIQWGLMVCVYCISHIPALLMLNIANYTSTYGNLRLVLYLLVVVQSSDIFQYLFGKLFGKHKIAPHISPNKTIEGFIGGVLGSTLLGGLLWNVTPFSPQAAVGISLASTLLGFFGGLTMSAIKRDRGIKDYGSSLKGHGGILDRIDSLCFSAPIFFHIVRYFYT